MMRLLVCLLLSLAAGCFAYLVGAVVWCAIDPLGAGGTLLFTLPPAIAGVATPALLAMIGLINRAGRLSPSSRYAGERGRLRLEGMSARQRSSAARAASSA